MANLEDIKTILLESRQAWAAAHKELVAALKTGKTTNAKTADKSGRVGMPDLSGIMPQDMRQIFSSFQNTLRQIFGGTSLAKFETTLKNTIGRAVGSQGSNFLKQAAATAAGTAAGRMSSMANSSYGGISPSLVQHMKIFGKGRPLSGAIPGQVTGTGYLGDIKRYGWRTVQARQHWTTDFAGMPVRRLPNFQGNPVYGSTPTKDQLKRLAAYGFKRAFDPNTGKAVGGFQQGKFETEKEFFRRVRNAIKGVKDLHGDLAGPRDIPQRFNRGRWGDDPIGASKMGSLERWSNRIPLIGKITDAFRRAKNLVYDNVGPLFKTPAGAGWVGPLGRVGVAASVGARAVGATFAAGKAAWTAARIGGATALRAGAAAGTAMGTAASTGLAGTAAALGLTNPVGWAVALILAVPAIAGFTELLYKSQSGLKDFSAGMATVFARSDLAKLKRNLISSERRSMVAGWLQTQSDAFKDKMLWIWDGLFNVVGTIAAGLLWLINTVGGIFDIIKSIWNWLKSWFVKEPTGIDMGPLGNTLKEFGLGRSEKLRSPGLFDWGGA